MTSDAAAAAAGAAPETVDVDGVLLDIDGVVSVSWRPVPGAADAMGALDDAGMPWAFLTSTTSLTRAEIVDRLNVAGIAATQDRVLTAAALTAEYLDATYPGARVWLLNSGADIAEDMPGITIDDSAPEVVVLGGAGEGFDHATLSRVMQLMVQGIPVVAMHRSLVWATDDGLLLDTGAFLPGLEAAGGAGITVVGKPAMTAFLGAADRTGIDPTRLAMVGDDLNADVLAAQRAGLTGILVRTGKFRQAALDNAREAPHHVIDSVEDLPRLLGVGAPGRTERG